jgi:thioredoxin-like negative regulator of GroEL
MLSPVLWTTMPPGARPQSTGSRGSSGGWAQRSCFQEAEPYCRKALEATPADPRALTLQARALIAAGRNEEAAAVLGRALAIRPDPEAQRLLA